MNGHISLFVSGKPTALLLTVRDEGTEWMEANLPPHVQVFYNVKDVKASDFKLILCVSTQAPNSEEVPMICYVPRAVHLGIGLAREAGPTRNVQKAIFEDLQSIGILPPAIASISTIDAKSGEPVVKALKKKYPVHFYTAEQLAKIEVPHPSKTVMKHMGTPSVSEAAALLSSGNGELLMPKKKEKTIPWLPLSTQGFSAGGILKLWVPVRATLTLYRFVDAGCWRRQTLSCMQAALCPVNWHCAPNRAPLCAVPHP